MSSNEKSLFTPCRPVGLRRKSLGSPLPSTSQRIDSSINYVSDSRDALFRHTENLNSNFVNNSLSSFVDLPQPTSKRPKLAITCTSTTLSIKEKLQEKSVRIPHHAEIGCRISPPDESSLKSNLGNEPPCEPNMKEIQLLINSIEERIFSKRNQIIDVESQIMNAKQHDLQAMNDLISKWRLGCQQALDELLMERKEHPEDCSMVNLLDFLGIPGELVHYSDTLAEFYD